MSLNLELLKQYRVSAVATDAIERSGAQDRVWLEYIYRKLHPCCTQLQFLPTKLVEWKDENMDFLTSRTMDFLTSRTLPSGVYPS